jgi:hypothetical protein
MQIAHHDTLRSIIYGLSGVPFFGTQLLNSKTVGEKKVVRMKHISDCLYVTYLKSFQTPEEFNDTLPQLQVGIHVK